MHEITRRAFIKVAAISAATMALDFGWPRWAQSMHGAATHWGDIPWSSVWPLAYSPKKILEVFLYGGLSPWETFYVRPTLSDPWRGFATEVVNLSWNCSGAPVLTSPGQPETSRFGTDALGQDVYLGPFTKPLWRPHLRNRMRIVVLAHGLEPHEAAIPYALSGSFLGRPNLAGLGAAVQHRYLELNPRSLPYSYVLLPQVGNIQTDNLAAATATGRHGGDARPLSLKIGAGTDTLLTRLQRSNMAASSSNLINQYRSQYRDQLRWQGLGDPTRSKGFMAYDASAASLFDANSLLNLLNNAPRFRYDAPCAHVPTPPTTPTTLGNIPGTAIRYAAHLLTRQASQAARYVCVIDAGLVEAAGGGGYDTHNKRHIVDTAVNLWNTLSALADVIQDPNQPADPNKIDLNETLIILNTEFGREPKRIGDGRDHWPQGYVNVLIGGPIPLYPTSPPTSQIAGAIKDDGYADKAYTPTDLRAAALLAASINPFASENFGVGSLSATLQVANSEEQTALNLRRQILGV